MERLQFGAGLLALLTKVTGDGKKSFWVSGHLTCSSPAFKQQPSPNEMASNKLLVCVDLDLSLLDAKLIPFTYRQMGRRQHVQPRLTSVCLFRFLLL